MTDTLSESKLTIDLLNILSLAGLTTSMVASDEDGYSHEIRFENEACKGKIFTERGILEFIESDTKATSWKG